MAPETDTHRVVLCCQGCPWNEATHLARNGADVLRLCECCAQAHDEADGWTLPRYRVVSPASAGCDPENHRHHHAGPTRSGPAPFSNAATPPSASILKGRG